MISVSPVVLVARAEAAVRLSATDPRLALTRARAVLAETRAILAGTEAGTVSRTGTEPKTGTGTRAGSKTAGTGPARSDAGAYGEAMSVALRAAALASRELGDLRLADERLRQAIEAGRGFPARVAQARMSLVAVRALLGDPEGGLRLADLAERHLTGTDPARLDVQRSVALTLLGRYREAVHHCDRALRRLGDDPWFQSGGLLNRGVALTYLEEYGAAEADLSECARIARAAGLDHVAMLAEGNLPFVAARRGDIAAAFARYEVAETGMTGYPERLAAMRADFAEALVAAHLPGEARALLEQALPELVACGARAAIPEARLLLAQARLLAGDAEQAAATARTALAELRAQGRTALAPLATEVMLRARLAGPPPDGPKEAEVAALLPRLLACAAGLERHGRPGAAAALRLTTARAALPAGRRAVARAQLELLTGTSAPPLIRQHALAMLRHLDGDLTGALESARAGVETLATAGSAGCDAELRAYAVRPAEDLAAFGLDLALETGDAWTVLDWAERWRALVRGGPVPVPLRPATPSGPPEAPEDGPATLIELVRSGDDLWGVLVAPARAGGARCVLRPLGSYLSAAEATVRVRYGLRRRNLRDLAPCGEKADHRGDTVSEVMDGELTALGEQLLGPFALDGLLAPDSPLSADAGASRRPVVIVPTGALCTLPWPLLPALAGRPVSVAPDAASWSLPDGSPMERCPAKRNPAARSTAVLSPTEQCLAERNPAEGCPAERNPVERCLAERSPVERCLAERSPVERCLAERNPAERRPAGRGRPHRPVVLAVAGPGLRHAREEADMVVMTHAGAERIDATRREVLAALERADVLHVAAHGMSSPRSPMLSRLSLDDGQLMAYDLLRADRVPRLVVLSACDAGMAHAPVDGAALGLAGTFLDRGAACVIAGVVPVRDDEALTLMTVFHAVLAEGRSPAEALGVAAAKTAVAGFVCFGDPYGRRPG